MKKINRILKKLFWSDDGQDTVLVADKDATFNVNLGDLLVGTLCYSDGIWEFCYSEEFKNQSRILPLANFPVKDKVYQTRELWPFFTSRIPSNAQLQIDKDKSKSSVIEMLHDFGRWTIANPFELKQV